MQGTEGDNRRESEIKNEEVESQLRDARRKFLMSCGKFAVVTPSAVTLLLSASTQNYATAGSNNGFGNGGSDGVPGRSNFQDVTR